MAEVVAEEAADGKRCHTTTQDAIAKFVELGVEADGKTYSRSKIGVYRRLSNVPTLFLSIETASSDRSFERATRRKDELTG